LHNPFMGEPRMVVDDHESVLVSADALVLIERQVDRRQTRVIHALAEKRDGVIACHCLERAAQAFVPNPKGTLVFGKALLPRAQGKLRYPWP
jgi:hypothetical protein